jgi:hypothetical protein
VSQPTLSRQRRALAHRRRRLERIADPVERRLAELQIDAQEDAVAQAEAEQQPARVPRRPAAWELQELARLQAEDTAAAHAASRGRPLRKLRR